MAAFSTVLFSLLLDGELDGPVVAAAGVYHESALLLERALPGRARFVDEPALPEAIEQLRPRAVFLDSLSNTARMPVPDLTAVLDALRGTTTRLIVDNTMASITCQPFASAHESVRLTVFESLLKYAQLGLDRANAGVIVARAADAERLDHYREHLGTNIPDVAVHALPTPNRAVLERRLARITRNAARLADRLVSFDVVYPGHGGCLNLIADDERLVDAMVGEATRRAIPLHAGTSFGFDVTRVHRIAATQPFIRIAAGTEHTLVIDALATVLEDSPWISGRRSWIRPRLPLAL